MISFFRWEHKYADAVCIPSSWDIAFPSKTKHLQTVPCSEERRAVYLFYEFARSRQTRLDLTKEEKQCQNAQNSRCLSILISQMKSESRCFNSTKTLSMPEKPMKVLLRIAMTSISLWIFYGIENLIGPGVAPGSGNSICCEIRFTDENEFCRAYGILTQESKSHSLEGPFPWAARSGLVEDKFGVGWALYYNE